MHSQITAELERIITQLSAFCDGNQWVTKNFTTKVASIREEKAIQKINGHSHSVAK